MLPTKVRYVTNRPPLVGGYGPAAGAPPPPDPADYAPLRFGTVDVKASAIPGTPGALLSSATEVGRDSASAASPTSDLVKFLAAFLSEAASNGATPLIYVHGFDFSFSEAVVWTADIAAFYAADVAAPQLLPLVFTWPSVNQVTVEGYTTDRASAQRSGHALSRLLVALAEASAQCGQPPIHLLAHSMGVFVLDNGLATLAGSGYRAPSGLFTQAVVIAGDDDRTAFSANGGLRPLLSLASWVTIGINNNDATTSLDQNMILHRERLANTGPDDLNQLTSNACVVDYTAAAAVHGQTPPGETDWDFWTHNYYHTVPRVRADLAQVFAGLAPDQVSGRVPAGDHPQPPAAGTINPRWLYVLPFPQTLTAWLQASRNFPVITG